jgi:uncharacterized protein YifN (PemK superfamily)
MSSRNANEIRSIFQHALAWIVEHLKKPVSRYTLERVIMSYQTRYPKIPSPARARMMIATEGFVCCNGWFQALNRVRSAAMVSAATSP